MDQGKCFMIATSKNISLSRTFTVSLVIFRFLLELVATLHFELADLLFNSTDLCCWICLLDFGFQLAVLAGWGWGQSQNNCSSFIRQLRGFLDRVTNTENVQELLKLIQIHHDT